MPQHGLVSGQARRPQLSLALPTGSSRARFPAPIASQQMWFRGASRLSYVLFCWLVLLSRLCAALRFTKSPVIPNRVSRVSTRSACLTEGTDFEFPPGLGKRV